MSRGRALACLTMDPEPAIRREISRLESREECRQWAEMEQKEMGRTWVFEALAERAQDVDGGP